MERHSPRAQEQSTPERSPEEKTPTRTAPRTARTLASLRHRNYRLYWLGQLISLMGTLMQTTGQAWLVLQLTHSAWQLGLVGALQFLPVLLFTLFGGVFADRWPKRQVLLITQAAALLQALLLWALVAANIVQIWHVYVLAVLLGITSSLDRPTRSAFVVEMVGREDLPNAVALSSMLTNLASVVGPGFGGILIAAANGVAPLFLLNALSFLAAIGGLALMKPGEFYAQARQPSSTGTQAADAGERQSTWQSLREGVAYVWQTPVVLLLTLVVGLVLLLGANYNVVLPLFATNVLHTGATGYGFLSAALSGGALLSALWLALGNRQPTIRRVLFGVLLYGLLEAAFALSSFYPLSLALIAGVGVAESIFGALAITMLQTVTPDHLRGRVSSVYVLFFTGSIPPGYLLVGWLSSAYGVSMCMLICALLCLLTAGAGWLWRKSAEQDVAAAPV
ncbi:MAG TPA: MFS transporter [Ktedonobacterales bacterium]|nr:MFS transporter [Ktedonobacterales bacterium]